MIIRRASVADAAALIALNRLFDQADTITGDVGSVERSLSENPTEEVYVAESEGRLVGFATLQLTRSFCFVRPTGELTALFVHEQHRRTGIASRLIRAVVKRCEELEVLELFLRVHRTNDSAIGCYQRNGLEEAKHFEYRIKYYR